MAFKELFKKYKIYTIVGIIILLMLVAGGTTAGVLLTKQDKEQINNSANAAVGSTFTLNNLRYRVLTEGTTNTVEIYYNKSTSIRGAIEIPSQVSNGGITYTVTEIGNSAFYNCSGLTSVTIPDSVTSIGTSAFSGCSGLTRITIGNSVTSIGSSAFSGCRALTEINFNATNMNNLSYGNRVFSYAGQNGTGITVNIGANVTRIPAYLFYPYSSSYVPNIVTVNFADNSQCESIGNYAFGYCDGFTEITIPASVTSIGSSAFYNCSGLTEITIPESVTSIGNSAFSGCSRLTSINVDTNNANYSSVDGVLFNKDQTTIVCYPVGKTDTSYIIPSSVTRIGTYAFRGCSGLTSITIPASVTSIESSAFYNCSGLTSITIPNSVTSIGDFVFYGCSGLTSITIPNSVTSIGDSVFYGCSGLTGITIPNSVTSIGESVFEDCSSLTSITIPNSVTSIGDYAFQQCSGLTSVTIPESVNSIGRQVFNNCSGLTSITIPDSVTSIGNSAFRNCTSLTSITIPDSVTSIGTYAFYDCSSLNNVYFYNNISIDTSSIGNYAFGNGSSEVTYWVKDQTSLTNIQAIYDADTSATKFTSNNFQIMPSVTITTDANLGQIFVNGRFTTNYNEAITNESIVLSNVIAVPKQNSAFLYWLVTTSSGTTQMPDNPLSMSITEDTTITAVFSNSLMEGIGVVADGGGQVRVGGYDLDNVDDTTQVTLNAICYSGYTFDGWYTMENGVLTKIDALGNFTAVTINVADYDGKLIIARFIPNNNGNVNEDTNN